MKSFSFLRDRAQTEGILCAMAHEKEPMVMVVSIYIFQGEAAAELPRFPIHCLQFLLSQFNSFLNEMTLVRLYGSCIWNPSSLVGIVYLQSRKLRCKSISHGF